MRIVSWNILQGGGRRTADVVKTLSGLDADVVALQEFRHGQTKPALFAGFNDMGYEHLLFPDPATPETGSTESTHTLNSVGLVGRYPLEGNTLLPKGSTSVPATLALQARITIIDADVPDIDIIVVHLPHKQKQPPYFETLLNLPATLRSEHTLIIGDFNCGIPFEDSETKTFSATRQFQALLSQGWIDAWRSRNPHARQFTWVSSRKGNGFRYDHALVSPALNERINTIEYMHSPREQGISDHSILVMDID